MTLVVDASVAIKWVLPETGSERAVAIRAQNDDLIAPSLVYAEIGNAIWRAVLRGDVSAQDAHTDLAIAIAHYRRLVALDELADMALALAVRLRHPVYDCLYLALAQRERCALITADRRLLNAAVAGIEMRAL
jgi:predicted nucleic acid-binding protein